jgi:lipoate-protein ligase A
MGPLHYLDRTLPDAAENLALDEALLLEAEAGRGPEVLRVWESPAPVVVLGAGCKTAEEVDEDACARDGVRVLRRSSGGGTVLLGPGCLLYTLVLRYDRAPELAEIRSSYCHILRHMARAVGVSAALPAGTSDLAVAGRKISGNAQQRKRDHLLHHGSLLYAFDLRRVGRYLRPPPREPDYREGRAHEQFLVNLGFPADRLKEGLRREWEASDELQTWPEAEVRRLVAEKYASDAWVHRR